MEPEHIVQRLRTLAVLARLPGARVGYRELINGFGEGVPHGRLRFVLEVDATEFWRTFSEVHPEGELNRPGNVGGSNP